MPTKTVRRKTKIPIEIRSARIPNVAKISNLVNDSAEYGLMLHRSLSFLYEHVRDFRVAVRKNQIVGVCGLNIVWANLAEVFSLVVARSQRGKGIGKQLVLDCVEDARQLGIHKLMTLTYEVDFFKACGFEVIDRQQLPLKVWSECLRCSRNQACDETAMIRVLEDVPECVAPQPKKPPKGSYEVPVPLGIRARTVKRRPKMDLPQ